MQQRQSSPLDVRKFQFDDFTGDDLADGGIYASAQPDITYSSAEMAAIKLAAESEAYTRGVADTEAAIEGEIQRLLTTIVKNTEVVLAEQVAQRDLIGSEAVRLASQIACKALPAMAESGALQEIEALIARCLSERPEEARLVIRVHDEKLDAIQERLTALRAQTGFTGKPILLADPALKRTEIRIEWANGGVDWSFHNQLADIESAARRLALRPAGSKAHDVSAAHDDSEMPTEICGDTSPEIADIPVLETPGRATMSPTEPLSLEDIDTGITPAEAKADGLGAQMAGFGGAGKDLEAIYDIPVQVSAVLGTTHMQVSQLLKLGRGAVVELDRKVGEAIDIYVNNRLVARGEVVVVDDRLGVTMTEIIKNER